METVHWRDTPDDETGLCGAVIERSSQGTPWWDLVTCDLCKALDPPEDRVSREATIVLHHPDVADAWP